MKTILPLPVTLLVILAIAGCASRVPETIRLDPGDPLTVAEVQADPAATRGQRVRWGGEVLSVRNRAGHTDLVVLRRGLFSAGEPRPSGGEAKRFIARLQGFVDPAELPAGSRITVVGTLEGLKTLRVGEYPYPHPVVRVRVSHTWPEYRPAPEPPWHRDPFYCDPFWPWGHHRRPFCW